MKPPPVTESVACAAAMPHSAVQERVSEISLLTMGFISWSPRRALVKDPDHPGFATPHIGAPPYETRPQHSRRASPRWIAGNTGARPWEVSSQTEHLELRRFAGRGEQAREVGRQTMGGCMQRVRQQHRDAL